MSTQLAQTLAERPYAVGVREPDEPRTTYAHFADKRNAAKHAALFDDGTNHVTRWVALGEPEWRLSASTPGWRQVTYFA